MTASERAQQRLDSLRDCGEVCAEFERDRNMIAFECVKCHRSFDLHLVRDLLADLAACQQRETDLLSRSQERRMAVQATGRVQELETELAALKAWFDKYAAHLDGCQAYDQSNEADCTCGLRVVTP